MLYEVITPQGVAGGTAHGTAVVQHDRAEDEPPLQQQGRVEQPLAQAAAHREAGVVGGEAVVESAPTLELLETAHVVESYNFV